jgi:transposase
MKDLDIGKLLAECRDLRTFQARQLVAFAGLNPRHHSSGSPVHKKPTISRTGPSALRAALYIPAVVAMRYNPILPDLACDMLLVAVVHDHVQFREAGVYVHLPVLCWLDKFRAMIVETFFSTG